MSCGYYNDVRASCYNNNALLESVAPNRCNMNYNQAIGQALYNYEKKCGCSRCCPPPKPVCKPVCEPVCKPKCKPVCPPPACVDNCACPCDEDNECEGITILNQSSWAPALILVNGEYPGKIIDYTTITPKQPGTTLSLVYSVPASMLYGASIIKFTDATYNSSQGNIPAGFLTGVQFDLREGSNFRLHNTVEYITTPSTGINTISSTAPSSLTSAPTAASTTQIFLLLSIDQTRFYYTGSPAVTNVITQSWQPSFTSYVPTPLPTTPNVASTFYIGSNNYLPTNSSQYLAPISGTTLANNVSETSALALLVPINFYAGYGPTATGFLNGVNTYAQYGGPYPVVSSTGYLNGIAPGATAGSGATGTAASGVMLTYVPA